MSTNKTTTALLVGTLFGMGCVGSALAADVEIYGKADVGIEVNHFSGGAKAKTQFQMTNGGSRWGINIREKISDDLSVRGYLENGFDLDTGKDTISGKAFGRRSILALQSKQYGELGFGRMGTVTSTNSPYARGLAYFDPFETGYTGDFTISGIFATDSRVDNAITYYSPRIAGWQVGATYSFQTAGDEVTGAGNNDRVAAALITYADDRLNASLGASTIMWGNVGSNSVREDSVEVQMGMRYAMTEALYVYLGAQYMKDWRTMSFWRSQNRTLDEAGTAEATAAEANGVDAMVYITGFRWKVAGPTTLIGSYAYFDGEKEMTNGTTVDGSRHRLSAGVEHKLSKRTQLYLVANATKNEDEIAALEQWDEKYSALLGITHNF